MTNDSYEVNQDRSANDITRLRVQPRKPNERAIQDSIVIIGSLMFLSSFGLLVETNLRDNGWRESDRKKITVFSSCFAFALFSMFFILYFLKRWKKSCRRHATQQSDQNVSESVSEFFVQLLATLSQIKDFLKKFSF